MATVDLRQQGWDSAAKDSADGIIAIINAKAKADQANSELKKNLMLDQITRHRNLVDNQQKLQQESAQKLTEQNNSMNAWDAGVGSIEPQGMANGQTPNQVGTNPAAPVPNIGAFPTPTQPPMSMADPSQQPANDAAQVQPQVDPQQAAQALQAQVAQPDHPASQLADLGFTPIGVHELGVVRKWQPQEKDKAYVGAYMKAKNGTASPQELQLIRDFNGVKDNSDQEQKQKDKQDELLQKRLESMGKQIDPTQYRSGAFGDAKKVFDRGERLSSLMDAAVKFQQGGADSRQIQELATGLNSMLAGNNVSAVEQVKGLVPHSAIGNATKLAEWFSNEPLGLNQQKFVERMMNTVNNEMATTKAQMDRTRFERLSSYYLLEKNHPEEFNAVLRGHGINPDDYQAWKDGGSKDFSAIQEKQAGAGGKTNNAPSVGTVDSGYRFKGGDPSNQNSWEKV